jgi:CheY-like chemotaxis protein
MNGSGEILLVGGDSLLAVLVRRVLNDLEVGRVLVRSARPNDALTYLRTKEGGESCLVLLALDSVPDDALELLRLLKSDARLSLIPVVVLDVSAYQGNAGRWFESGAVGYIRRSAGSETLADQLRTVVRYWRTSRLPHLERKDREHPNSHSG